MDPQPDPADAGLRSMLATLEDAIRAQFEHEQTGHDLHHLRRVMRAALHLQAHEGGDRTVVAVAALVHDVHRLVERETGRYCAPRDSLPAVERLLDHVDLDPQRRRHVLHAVAHHEEYGFAEGGRTATDLETLLLQDADNLDALGALGIARTFAFGGAYGLPLWRPEVPLEAAPYRDDERDPSVVHHIHRKLLRLGADFNTDTARAMARARHAFMQAFVERFRDEWDGRC